MCLTEAIHIVTLMSTALCREAWVASGTDPLLRSVCGWRLHATAQYEALAQLVGSGDPCSPRDLRTRDRYSFKDCVEMALLDDQAWTRAALARHCGCTLEHVQTLVYRLRAEGCPILHQSQSRSAGGGTYFLKPLKTKAS